MFCGTGELLWRLAGGSAHKQPSAPAMLHLMTSLVLRLSWGAWMVLEEQTYMMLSYSSLTSRAIHLRTAFLQFPHQGSMCVRSLPWSSCNWKTKTQQQHPCSPVLHKSTCLEVTPGKLSGLVLFPSGKGTVVWSHSVAWLTNAFSSKNGRNMQCFLQCDYS